MPALPALAPPVEVTIEPAPASAPADAPLPALPPFPPLPSDTEVSAIALSQAGAHSVLTTTIV